jgi:hypothetical protein
MQIDNTKTTRGEDNEIVTVMPGVHINVSKGSTLEYLQMRAAQLSALNHLLTSGDFDGWSQAIQSDAKWLAASLAAEVSQLASVVTFG